MKLLKSPSQKKKKWVINALWSGHQVNYWHNDPLTWVQPEIFVLSYDKILYKPTHN